MEEALDLSSDRILNELMNIVASFKYWCKDSLKLLDDLEDRREHSQLKEEALDRTTWRNRFGGGFGHVVRQNTE